MSIGSPQPTCRPCFTARLPALRRVCHCPSEESHVPRNPRRVLGRYSPSGIRYAFPQALRGMIASGSSHLCGNSRRTSRKEYRPTCSSGYIGFKDQSNFLACVREGSTPRLVISRIFFNQFRPRPKNEIYFTLDTEAILPPSNVVRHCTVTDQPPKENSTKVASAGHSRPANFRQNDITLFYCRFALDSRKGLYYDLAWCHHKQRALSESDEEQTSGRSWNVPVESPKQKTTRAQKRSRLKEIAEADESLTRETDTDYEHQEPVEDSDDELPIRTLDLDSVPDAHSETLEDDLPKTPSRKRKRTVSTPSKSTPRKSRSNKLAAPTPHSKAAIRKRNSRKVAVVRVPPPDLTREHYKQLQRLPQDAWLRAMHVLHVAARPDILPCRGEEYNRVLRTVEELLEEGSGGCVCGYFGPCSGDF